MEAQVELKQAYITTIIHPVLLTSIRIVKTISIFNTSNNISVLPQQVMEEDNCVDMQVILI
jgi:hypothetical protein